MRIQFEILFVLVYIRSAAASWSAIMLSRAVEYTRTAPPGVGNPHYGGEVTSLDTCENGSIRDRSIGHTTGRSTVYANEPHTRTFPLYRLLPAGCLRTRYPALGSIVIPDRTPSVPLSSTPHNDDSCYIFDVCILLCCVLHRGFTQHCTETWQSDCHGLPY